MQTCLAAAYSNDNFKILVCQIRSKMDEKIDPCEDFYEFACGNYLKETEIPDDKVATNIFTHFGDKIVKNINVLLNQPVNETDNRPFRMAKDLYKSCNNISEYLQTYNKFAFG